MDSQPIARKVTVAGITGGITFLATNLSDQPPFPAAVLSLLVGGIVLLVQFLFDLERRQLGVEAALELLHSEHATQEERMRSLVRAELAKTSDATALHQQLERVPHGLELVQRVVASSLSAVEGDQLNLAVRVAQAELSAAIDLLDVVTRGGEASAQGEDRDWLTTLTRLSSRSINAISHGSETSTDTFSDDGFWNTEIGNHYLELQREAIHRGVQVRRLFVVPNNRVASHPELLELVWLHQAVGVHVRILRVSDLSPSRRQHLPDVAIFDEQASYELVGAPRLEPTMPRYFVNTRFTAQPEVVQARLQLFEDLWNAGVDALGHEDSNKAARDLSDSATP